MGYLLAVQGAAVAVHARVGTDRIILQYAIEPEQTIEYVTPVVLGYVAQAADANAGSMKCLAILNHSRPTTGDLFEQRKFYGWYQRVEFRQVQNRGLLE